MLFIKGTDNVVQILYFVKISENWKKYIQDTISCKY